MMNVRVFRPAPLRVPDRGGGRPGSHHHDPAAAVLRGAHGRQPVPGRLADRHLRGLPAGVGPDSRPTVRHDGPQTAAHRQPDRHLHRLHRHRLRSQPVGAVPGARHRRCDGGKPVAGAGLHRRRHAPRGARQVVRHHRHRVRARIPDRPGGLGTAGRLRLPAADLRGRGAVGDQRRDHVAAAPGGDAGRQPGAPRRAGGSRFSTGAPTPPISPSPDCRPGCGSSRSSRSASPCSYRGCRSSSSAG